MELFFVIVQFADTDRLRPITSIFIRLVLLVKCCFEALAGHSMEINEDKKNDQISVFPHYGFVF